MADSPYDKLAGLTTVTVGKVFKTPLMQPPGIVTGVAYTDLEAMGTAFSFRVPVSGIIQSANYYDLDDEGLQVDLLLMDNEPAVQTDNSPVSFSDDDLIKIVTRIQFTTFADVTNGQFSEVKNIGRPYVQENRVLWAQLQARGALNIAAGNLPMFRIFILADE